MFCLRADFKRSDIRLGSCLAGSATGVLEHRQKPLALT